MSKNAKDLISRLLQSVPAQRIRSLVPETKLIVLMRDPVERVVSRYREQTTFVELHKTGEMPPPLTPLQLRERAAQFAQETVENQRESFKRYGVWADWDQPYLTLQPAYEAAQLTIAAVALVIAIVKLGKSDKG